MKKNYFKTYLILSFVYHVEERSVYRNNLKNREFRKEAPEQTCLERATIAARQGASEDLFASEKPTLPKTDSSGYFGINLKIVLKLVIKEVLGDFK